MLCFRTFLLLAVLSPASAHAGEYLRIAVASNFLSTAQEIAVAFEAATGMPVRLSSGSTGRLYAQIVNGAPYDIFLAADVVRPRQLLDEGIAVPGSQTTYALGSLVLWSTDSKLSGKDCRAALEEGRYRYLAIANPLTAPYGLAAREFLQTAQLWDSVQGRLVLGENISQTFQFVASGNATLGLVASSQLATTSPLETTCSWSVQSRAATMIRHDGVILSRASDMEAAQRFMEFIREPRMAKVLQQRGYRVPDSPTADAR